MRGGVQYYQLKGVRDVSIDEIYLGNGVSELIVMAMQGLLDDGDESLAVAGLPVVDGRSHAYKSKHPFRQGAVLMEPVSCQSHESSIKLRALHRPEAPSFGVFWGPLRRAHARTAIQRRVEIWAKAIEDFLPRKPSGKLCELLDSGEVAARVLRESIDT